MSGRILQELRQRRPFDFVEEEAFLNVYRTADVLAQQLLKLLKTFNLSLTQYNILRILRGAGGEGLTCSEIGSRLLTPDPDITRLLDRLEKRKVLVRSRGRKDRRCVTIHITDEGLSTLSQLDGPIRALQVEIFRPLDEPKLRQLIALLETVRAGQPGVIMNDVSVPEPASGSASLACASDEGCAIDEPRAIDESRDADVADTKPASGGQ